jgi:hypothetical protein
MSKMMDLKLQVLQEFQKQYPTSHVGGSIGLMLRGIDLQRDLQKSDLDITIDEFEFVNESNMEHRSDANDFDFCLKRILEDGLYVKIDIRVTPEPSYDVIEFDGIKYNVSKYRHIIFWKKKYANKGCQKHTFDLVAIETGARPTEPVLDICDLPF